MSYTNTYIRGLRLAEISNSAATRQYTFNAHGDVTGLVDTTTGAVTDYTYDAYGNEDNASATDTNPFRYSGEYYDAETGFIYLRARYYDPSIGRFTAEDTHWTSENMVFGDKAYQPNEIKIPSIEAIKQSTNLYAYCMNNPTQYVDPSGKVADWVIIALYGYAQTVMSSPDLQYDMQMLAYDISQKDYASAAFGVVDILAPGFSGSKMVPKYIRKHLDELVDWVKSFGKNADELPSGWTKVTHGEFTHIRDAEGRIRVRIDPPDAKTIQIKRTSIFMSN